jgi:hypothetical protein
MNNWSDKEIAFRCDRLPVRIERLTQNFLRIASLSLDETAATNVLDIIRESKSFIELIAIDLDIDRAFELAQMQRQLSQWHVHWPETWTNEIDRHKISTIAQIWVSRLREMSGAFV